MIVVQTKHADVKKVFDTFILILLNRDFLKNYMF